MSNLTYATDSVNASLNGQAIPLIQRHIRGKFPILGEGHFASVYDVNGVAVKVYDNYYDNHVINRELETVKAVNGAKILPNFYRVDEDEELIYMEKLQGTNLTHRHLKEMSLDKVKEVIEQVEDGFLEILTMGYVSNDIHGGNVLYTQETGELMFVDVGHYEAMTGHALQLIRYIHNELQSRRALGAKEMTMEELAVREIQTMNMDAVRLYGELRMSTIIEGVSELTRKSYRTMNEVYREEVLRLAFSMTGVACNLRTKRLTWKDESIDRFLP